LKNAHLRRCASSFVIATYEKIRLIPQDSRALHMSIFEQSEKKDILKTMDEIDKKILNILQREFPLEEQPFLIVGNRCGISEDETISRIRKMKEEGIIRRIGAVFNGAKLGRVSTLCAVRVPEEKIDGFVAIVNANKNVTHNYRRDNEYNIWFTVSAATTKELKAFLKELKEKTGVMDILDMKAMNTFKINASFDI
jgi:DNA-binding Lrp family transcriptional regulator